MVMSKGGRGGGGRPFFIVHSPLTQSPEPPPPVLRPRTPQTTSTPIYLPNHTLVHPAHTPHRQPPMHPPNHPPTHTHTQTHNRQHNPTAPHRNEPLQITCSHVCDDLLLSDLIPTTVALPMCSAHSACFPNPPPGRPKQPGVYIVGPRYNVLSCKKKESKIHIYSRVRENRREEENKLR